MKAVLAVALVASSLLAGCGAAPIAMPVLQSPQMLAARAATNQALVLDGAEAAGVGATGACSANSETLVLTLRGHVGSQVTTVTVEGQGGIMTYCGVRMSAVCLNGATIPAAQAKQLLAQADASGLDTRERRLVSEAQNLVAGGFVMLQGVGVAQN